MPGERPRRETRGAAPRAAVSKAAPSIGWPPRGLLKDLPTAPHAFALHTPRMASSSAEGNSRAHLTGPSAETRTPSVALSGPQPRERCTRSNRGAPGCEARELSRFATEVAACGTLRAPKFNISDRTPVKRRGRGYQARAEMPGPVPFLGYRCSGRAQGVTSWASHPDGWLCSCSSVDDPVASLRSDAMQDRGRA